jgi:hypothetical protein
MKLISPGNKFIMGRGFKLPVINIESPKMTKEKKELLVKELTAKASDNGIPSRIHHDFN